MILISSNHISGVSPGSPKIKWTPVWIFLSKVICIASLDCSKVCPRLIRSSVLLRMVSTPYSIDTKIFLQIWKIVQFFFINAIRSCADDNSFNKWMFDGMTIDLFHFTQRRVRCLRKLESKPNNFRPGDICLDEIRFLLSVVVQHFLKKYNRRDWKHHLNNKYILHDQ